MEDLRRVHNWGYHLTRYIQASRVDKLVLDWSSQNCAKWALGAVEAITGVNLYPFEQAQNVRSPASAWKALQGMGYSRLSDVVAERLPLREGSPIRGDLVLVPVDIYGAVLLATAGDQDEDQQDQNSPAAFGMDVALHVFDGPVCWGLTEMGPLTIPYQHSYATYAIGCREDILCQQ